MITEFRRPGFIRVFSKHNECASEIPILGIYCEESVGDGGRENWRLCLVREA